MKPGYYAYDNYKNMCIVFPDGDIKFFNRTQRRGLIPTSKSVEGIYLRKVYVESKNKPTYLYYINSRKGIIGLWGNKKLDKILKKIPMYHLMRITAYLAYNGEYEYIAEYCISKEKSLGFKYLGDL